MDKLWRLVALTRRELIESGLVTGVIAGYAMAVQPVMAQTMIVTEPTGLDAGTVQIPVGSESIAAFRAIPSGAKSRPLILVVHEIFGVHEHIKDICRRLAKLGYCAIAVDLYQRQGDVSRVASIDQIRPIVAKVADEQVIGDLDAAVSWAVKQGIADESKLGITGFCWGGRFVWLYAAHNPEVKAGVAWYGQLVGEKTESKPTYPVDVATQIQGAVLGLYGGADAGIPVDTVEQMRKALGPNSKSQLHVYPGAPHAFFADYRPSYRKEAAEDGWKRATEWFKAHGVS
ncbi:MAG TPA: dienelactone hydrolase family protein [Hyphomicrobiaceae bacterium]|nr:dienelactone hydrolase family protein [Hyphomicrobiaceae bacterium]